MSSLLPKPLTLHEQDFSVGELGTQAKVLGLPAQKCLCLAFTLVAMSLLFMLGAVAAQDWAYFGTGVRKRTYGLMRCSDCPPGIAGTNWYCPLAIECTDKPESVLCGLSEDMYNAGNAYLVGQLPTFMLGLMLLERLLYGCMGKDYGWAWVVYLLGGLYPVAMVVSVVLWFASNSATYENQCEENYLNGDIAVCAGNGGQVAIVAAVLSVLAGALAVFVFYHRPAQIVISGLRNRLLMCGLMVLMLVILALYVAAPAHEEWIETDSHMGGLLKMKQWGPYSNLGYDCIAEPRCTLDEDLGSCKSFRRLHQGSMVFLFLEVGAIYSWLLWFEAACFYIIGREYGFSVWNYVTPLLSVGLHTIGTVIWLVHTQALLETSCQLRPEHSSERWAVCAKTGPILAIVNTGLGWLCVALYLPLYSQRHSPSPP